MKRLYTWVRECRECSVSMSFYKDICVKNGNPWPPSPVRVRISLSLSSDLYQQLTTLLIVCLMLLLDGAGVTSSYWCQRCPHALSQPSPVILTVTGRRCQLPSSLKVDVEPLEIFLHRVRPSDVFPFPDPKSLSHSQVQLLWI